MVGYPEALTDPSYLGQVRYFFVVLCAVIAFACLAAVLRSESCLLWGVVMKSSSCKWRGHVCM